MNQIQAVNFANNAIKAFLDNQTCPDFGGAAAPRGEDVAKFITAMHAKLVAYALTVGDD
jgi:hypothetical protein